jgi:hypothetical protein
VHPCVHHDRRHLAILARVPQGEVDCTKGFPLILCIGGFYSFHRSGGSRLTSDTLHFLFQCARQMKPMKYVVHCPMGVTLQARGTIRLPVVMPRGQSASVARSRAEDSPMSQSSSEGQGDEQHTPGEAGACKEGREEICGHGTVMTLSFVVVEGQVRHPQILASLGIILRSRNF